MHNVLKRPNNSWPLILGERIHKSQLWLTQSKNLRNHIPVRILNFSVMRVLTYWFRARETAVQATKCVSHISQADLLKAIMKESLPGLQSHTWASPSRMIQLLRALCFEATWHLCCRQNGVCPCAAGGHHFCWGWKESVMHRCRLRDQSFPKIVTIIIIVPSILWSNSR